MAGLIATRAWVRRKADPFAPSPKSEILRWWLHHSGETCVIVGNGPSALEHRLSEINCPTIGLNQAWRLRRWTYNVMGDLAQFDRYEEERGDISGLSPLFTTERGPAHATRIVGRPMTDRKRFSFDLSRDGVYLNNTVVSFAFQLACWMRFHTIYLIGIDCYGSHFYGGKDTSSEQFENQRETLGYIAGVLEHARPHVKVWNLSANSRVDAFERKRFDEVFP